MFDWGDEREGVVAGVEEGRGRDPIVVCGDVRRVDQDGSRGRSHVVARILGGARACLVARIVRIDAW